MVVKRTCNFTVLYWLSILLRVFITQNVCLSTMFVEVPGQSVLLACPELFNSPSIAPCFESQNLNGKTSNHGFRVLGFGVYGQSTIWQEDCSECSVLGPYTYTWSRSVATRVEAFVSSLLNSLGRRAKDSRLSELRADSQLLKAAPAHSSETVGAMFH